MRKGPLVKTPHRLLVAPNLRCAACTACHMCTWPQLAHLYVTPMQDTGCAFDVIKLDKDCTVRCAPPVMCAWFQLAYPYGTPMQDTGRAFDISKLNKGGIKAGPRGRPGKASAPASAAKDAGPKKDAPPKKKEK
eukprot:scaffold16175_cov21-Tisochrysis_lutea.AAC.1